VDRAVYQELAYASHLDQKGKYHFMIVFRNEEFRVLDRTKLCWPFFFTCILYISCSPGTEQAEFLRALQLFQNWPKDHLERFSSQLRRLKFKAGEYIFRQMHDSNGIYFIKAFTDR
jgi:hypothetical protein